MKKTVFYGIVLGLFIVLVGIGIADVVLETKYKNNDIQFVLKNQEAYFTAKCKYYEINNNIGKVDEIVEKEFNAQFLEEEVYNGENNTISNWEIGRSTFVYDLTKPDEDVNEFKYEIMITNKNRERGLTVSLKNIAIHEDCNFITKVDYKLGNNTAVTKFSNNPSNRVNADDQNYYDHNNEKLLLKINDNTRINYNEVLTITVSISLNSTEAFTYNNNFMVVLESVE